MSNTNIPFNLNSKVRVRLTDKGRSHLQRLHYDLYKGTVPYNPPNEIDGWTEFRLWDFIGKFGEFCQTPGFDLPFSPGIELVRGQKSFGLDCTALINPLFPWAY